MRIVQLNPFFYPFMGGIEHRIHNVSKRLAKKHEVIVLTSRLPGTEAEEHTDGYAVVRLRSRYLNLYNPPYVSTKGVQEALEHLAPDVIDLHFRWAPSYTKAVKSVKCAKLYTVHNTYGEGVGLMRYASLLNDWTFKRKVGMFDRVVCVSQYLLDQHAQMGYPRDRMLVVPNGVDIPAVGTEDSGFILSLGRLVRVKGLDFLIEAMKNVDSPLFICGAGPERDRLERKVQRMGLTQKVKFLGRVSEEKKQEMFSTCSMFVMPSLQEAYGVAAAEAMSYGKPVVTTRTGGLPEVVDDAGAMVPPRDAKSLAEAINKLMDDRELRQKLGIVAKKKALHYTWDRTAELLEKAYLNAVG
jgi:glycosyltransferase involved in cell wall biosynthesis